MSFNLSILECKCIAKQHQDISGSFNLSILECKLWKYLTRWSSCRVLIYPYWNVNMILPYRDSRASCFNLSILECKWLSADAAGCGKWCFNLSILECKFIMQLFVVSKIEVLIYPYWNVNDAYNICSLARCWRFNLSILECKSDWFSHAGQLQHWF